MQKNVVVFIKFLCMLIILTACGNIKSDTYYFQMFRFNHEYYRDDYMYTIKKPGKKVGTIDSVVEAGRLPIENNQGNISEMKGAVLYADEAEPEAVYIYNKSRYLEDIPVYERYRKGIFREEDLEDGLYNACIEYKDKLYLMEFGLYESIELDKRVLKEVGIIDTYYANCPSRNFSTNIHGIIGEKLYEDNENSNILYTRNRNEAGVFEEGKYMKYMYREKKKKEKDKKVKNKE